MKGRSAPELAAAAILALLDSLPVSDERRYYQNSSFAASLHCPSIQASMAAISPVLTLYQMIASKKS